MKTVHVFFTVSFSFLSDLLLFFPFFDVSRKMQDYVILSQVMWRMQTILHSVSYFSDKESAGTCFSLVGHYSIVIQCNQFALRSFLTCYFLLLKKADQGLDTYTMQTSSLLLQLDIKVILIFCVFIRTPLFIYFQC